jgi:hypothetical protein
VGALLALCRQAAGHTRRSLGERFVIGEQQIASIAVERPGSRHRLPRRS